MTTWFTNGVNTMRVWAIASCSSLVALTACSSNDVANSDRPQETTAPEAEDSLLQPLNVLSPEVERQISPPETPETVSRQSHTQTSPQAQRLLEQKLQQIQSQRSGAVLQLENRVASDLAGSAQSLPASLPAQTQGRQGTIPWGQPVSSQSLSPSPAPVVVVEPVEIAANSTPASAPVTPNAPVAPVAAASAPSVTVGTAGTSATAEAVGASAIALEPLSPLSSGAIAPTPSATSQAISATPPPSEAAMLAATAQPHQGRTPTTWLETVPVSNLSQPENTPHRPFNVTTNPGLPTAIAYPNPQFSGASDPNLSQDLRYRSGSPGEASRTPRVASSQPWPESQVFRTNAPLDGWQNGALSSAPSPDGANRPACVQESDISRHWTDQPNTEDGALETTGICSQLTQDVVQYPAQ